VNSGPYFGYREIDPAPKFLKVVWLQLLDVKNIFLFQISGNIFSMKTIKKARLFVFGIYFEERKKSFHDDGENHPKTRRFSVEFIGFGCFFSG
jgi:hypothetical protein